MADIELVIKIPEEEYQNYLKMRPAYPEGVFCYIEAIKNGTPLPEHHGDLIDRTELYNQTSEWEAQALEQVNRYNPEDSRDEWRWWSTVLKERGAFKHDVADAPTIIEGSDSE